MQSSQMPHLFSAKDEHWVPCCPEEIYLVPVLYDHSASGPDWLCQGVAEVSGKHWQIATGELGQCVSD